MTAGIAVPVGRLGAIPRPATLTMKGNEMAKYRPPHGALDFLLSGPRESKRMIRANEDYRHGYHQGKGRRDGSR